MTYGLIIPNGLVNYWNNQDIFYWEGGRGCMQVYHFKTNNTVKKNIGKVFIILNKYIKVNLLKQVCNNFFSNNKIGSKNAFKVFY